MLDDIAVFVKVVESGSFTEAAERLELSRSVVSKYITRLEERLGARLLNRTTRRLSLTEIGRMFYERTRAGMSEIDDAVSDVARFTEEARGLLRLNTPMSFGVLHIAPLLPEFMVLYPEVQVDMNLDDRVVDMIEPGYDLSIRGARLQDSSLVARPLVHCAHDIVASPDYLKRCGTPVTPADLSDHNVLLFRYQESASEWVFQDIADEHLSVVVSGNLRMNNSLALREAALKGHGIIRIPRFAIVDDLESGRLVSVLDGFRVPDLTIYAVYPDRRSMSPKVKAFVEFLVQRLPGRF